MIQQASGRGSSFFRPPGLGRAAAVLGLCATAALGASCASGQVLTQGEIGREGARTFATPPEAMFYACVGVLKANGYDIAHADRAGGVIVTKRKPVISDGPVTARAYRVTVWPEGKGSRVVAAPMVFAGERDLSQEPVWSLGGEHGERTRWERLFQDIDRVVVRTDVGPAEREALAKEAVPAVEPATATGRRPAPRLAPAGFVPARK